MGRYVYGLVSGQINGEYTREKVKKVKFQICILKTTIRKKLFEVLQVKE